LSFWSWIFVLCFIMKFCMLRPSIGYYTDVFYLRFWRLLLNLLRVIMRIGGVLYTSIFLTAYLCCLHLSQNHSFSNVSFSGLLNYLKQSAIVILSGWNSSFLIWDINWFLKTWFSGLIASFNILVYFYTDTCCRKV